METSAKRSDFLIYPAIDLRHGQVVRLRQGDPLQQTVYENDPAMIACHWLESGAHWLHVVNLDGAFGEGNDTNLKALSDIITIAQKVHARIQFGGGVRSLDDISRLLEMGVNRVILGTVVVEQPDIVYSALRTFGAEKVAVGLDARDGMVQVRGWQEDTRIKAVDLALSLAENGLMWSIFTDIARDGVGTGLNLIATKELIKMSGLCVIASGGVYDIEDVRKASEAGCAGVIIGRALYEKTIELRDAISYDTGDYE
ncbi:MAG: 1-(5-phosphoribosyl)-5-[(5-phosphoribosylamino)methylideneamino]imidazole-4-carboxamide isomerase [Chloroflexota bacterium]